MGFPFFTFDLELELNMHAVVIRLEIDSTLIYLVLPCFMARRPWSHSIVA